MSPQTVSIIKINPLCQYAVYMQNHKKLINAAYFEKNEMGGACSAYGEGRGVHRVLVGKPEGKKHWGDPYVDGRIILRRIFRKWEGVVGTRWSWLRIGRGGGHS
jgi:hypothetical protein